MVLSMPISSAEDVIDKINFHETFRQIQHDFLVKDAMSEGLLDKAFDKGGLAAPLQNSVEGKI